MLMEVTSIVLSRFIPAFALNLICGRCLLRDGKGPGANRVLGPAIQPNISQTSRSFLIVQFLTGLFLGGVSPPMGLPVLFGTRFAPDLARYGLGVAIPAEPKFPGSPSSLLF